MQTAAFTAGGAFSVTGAPLAADAAVIEAGFDLPLVGGAMFGVTYGGHFGRGSGDQSLKLNISGRF